jgi:hypothetical protein
MPDQYRALPTSATLRNAARSGIAAAPVRA